MSWLLHWHPGDALQNQSCSYPVFAARPPSTLLPHPVPLPHCLLACRMGPVGLPVHSFSNLDGSLGRRALVSGPLGERLPALQACRQLLTGLMTSLVAPSAQASSGIQ